MESRAQTEHPAESGRIHIALGSSNEFGEFTTRLSSISERARKLLVQIAESAYHGHGKQRKPDVAYLPELYESCGLGVEEMYPLLEELSRAGFIEVEDQYPFEDVKIAQTCSGSNPLAAIARFAEAEKIPLRDIIVDLRTELLK